MKKLGRSRKFPPALEKKRPFAFDGMNYVQNRIAGKQFLARFNLKNPAAGSVLLAMECFIRMDNIIGCTAEDIAQITGMRRENVSREITRLKACSLIFPVGKEGTKTLYRLNTMYGFAGKEADLAYQDEAFSVPPMRKVRAKKVSAPPKTVEKPRIVIRMADYRKSAIQEDESFSTYTTSISGGG